MHSYRIWRFLIWFVLFSIAGTMGWRFLRRSHTQKSHIVEQDVTSPVAVKVFQVKLVDVQSLNEFAGTVQSSQVVQVSSRIIAHIEEIPIYSGAIVKKDDLLVRLDDGDIQARIKQMQSAITAAEAIRIEAHRDHLRYQELVRNNNESRQKLEQAEARARSTAAAVETARQQLEEVKQTLGYTEIRASFEGIVVNKLAEFGDLASPGRVLLTIQNPTRLRMEVPISEHCARRIHIGNKVSIKIDSADFESEAIVSEIVPAVDPKSRSFIIRANLQFKTDLKPGMFGRLRFPCSPRKVLLVPSLSVLKRGQVDMVFVVVDNHAKLRMIRVGEEQKDSVEILTGLREGETVIVSPPKELQDGNSVVISPEKHS